MRGRREYAGQQHAYVVRVDRSGASGQTMQHLLESLAFTAVRDTGDLEVPKVNRSGTEHNRL
ncbi:MAG: hypothetical protein ABI607_05535 [Betaproteobacteria bacterium]